MGPNISVYEDLSGEGPLGFQQEMVNAALEELKAKRDRLDALFAAERGEQTPPWTPAAAGSVHQDLLKRATTNLIGLVVDASAQVLKVDNFRRAGEDLVAAGERSTRPSRSPRLIEPSASAGGSDDLTATGFEDWKHWRASRLEAGHLAVIRCALITGSAYMVTEYRGGQILSRGLSARRTVCLYEDPATDIDPVAALHVLRWPDGNEKQGTLVWWDTHSAYRATFRDGSGGSGYRFSVEEETPHGASVCPVTRLPLYRDLEGECYGIVEPLLTAQDRLNQSVADLLVAESYTAHEVRYVAGEGPPMKTYVGADGQEEVLLDKDGNPVPDRLAVNAGRWLFSEDPEVKYGHIPAADLRPLVASVELAMRHMSAIAQVPPHYLLGQIANVSADGLMAASIGLDRKNEELASLLGEGLERVFRVAADMRGEFDASSGEDFGEVMWADRSNQSIGAVADALGKFAQMLGVPQRGLWEMVPGVTRNQLDKWRELWRQEREQQFGYGASLDESDFEEFEGAFGPPEDQPTLPDAG